MGVYMEIFFICLPPSKENTGSSRGFATPPTITSLPLDFNKPINGKIG